MFTKSNRFKLSQEIHFILATFGPGVCGQGSREI